MKNLHVSHSTHHNKRHTWRQCRANGYITELLRLVVYKHYKFNFGQRHRVLFTYIYS
jgi:hypothetical protein